MAEPQQLRPTDKVSLSFELQPHESGALADFIRSVEATAKVLERPRPNIHFVIGGNVIEMKARVGFIDMSAPVAAALG